MINPGYVHMHSFACTHVSSILDQMCLRCASLHDKQLQPKRPRGRWSEKLFPWLSEMEQSVGWSRLVCSRQWQVKEITLGLCRQPWPGSHRNIMRKDMLGLLGRKRGQSLRDSSQTATGGKQLFSVLFYKLRSISKTLKFHSVERGGSWVQTYQSGASLLHRHNENTNYSATVAARMQLSPLARSQTSNTPPESSWKSMRASSEWQSLHLMTERRPSQ